MAEPATSDSSPDTDREFEPSADMLVHEYDDEHTLDEEEAMSGDSCTNELEDLEKEGEMPIEDLLAMYGYGPGNTSGPASQPSEPQDTRSSSEEEILSNQDLTLDKDEIARDLLKDDDHNKETSVNDLLVCVKELPTQTSRLLRSQSQAGSSDDEDSEDGDYQPVKDDDWKKMISVGSDYQAVVPDGLSKYGDAPAYENEDRLLWDPNKLGDAEIEKYLGDVHRQNQQCLQGVQAIPIPTNTHTRDDEQALYLLLQCGHNVDEALRRRKMQAVPPTDPMSLWSEEECRNFENGLRTYGKDFYLIQQNKVRTRSVGELVQFYYLWKKTERHDVFANKTRLEKKKYALHPGVTDYMDRFLDEQDNPTPVRERSASPSISSLIYGDPKRQHIELEAALEMVQKVVGSNNPVFSPLKLHPDLQPQATDASTEPHPAPQSTENTVHIANFTNRLPNDDLSNGLIEPSPKRLKLAEKDEEEEGSENKIGQRVGSPATTTAVNDTTTNTSTSTTAASSNTPTTTVARSNTPTIAARSTTPTTETTAARTTTDSPTTITTSTASPPPTSSNSSPSPSASSLSTNTTTAATTTTTTSSSTTPLKDLPPSVKTVSSSSSSSSPSSSENGTTHVNNVEVSISSVNSVHSLVEGSLRPSEPLPARPTEPIAQ